MFLSTAIHAEVYFSVCAYCDLCTYLSCAHVLYILGCFVHSCIVFSRFFGILFVLSHLSFCSPHLPCISLIWSALFPVSSPATQLPAYPCVFSLPPVTCLVQFLFNSWFSVQSCWILCSTLFALLCSVSMCLVQFYFACT